MDCLKKWSKGILHATQVQELCHHAYKDQINLLHNIGASTEHVNPLLAKISRLGNWGTNKGSMHRDLIKFLGAPTGVPEPLLVPVKCIVAKPGIGRPPIQTVDVPVMPPHLVIHELFHNNRARFDDLMFGQPFDPAQLRDFWKTVARRKDPRLANHPMIRKADWAERCIPISIHGDGVPAVGIGKAASKSFDCYAWQSILSVGSSSKVKVYVGGVFEDCKAKPSATCEHNTMRDLWRGMLCPSRLLTMVCFQILMLGGKSGRQCHWKQGGLAKKLLVVFFWFPGP